MTEPLPCTDCALLPVILNDDLGFSCVHTCLSGVNGLGGAWNYPTRERAVQAWNEYKGGQAATDGEGQS